MSSSEQGGPDGVAALRDLPRELWLELARAFRRAVEPLEDAELPAAVRPFRGWKPDRLLADRPRRAVAEALGGDARLRERVGAALGDKASRARMEALPLASLVAEVGEQRAAALLVAAGRWGDLATLSAGWAERSAARRRAAAERPPSDRGAGGDEDREAELVRARRERDEAERARTRAESRAQSLDADRHVLEAEVAGLRERNATLEETLRSERAKHRDRLGRARRRATEAEARASVDTERVRKAARELEQLADELRALGEEQPDGGGAGAVEATGFAARQPVLGGPLPRSVPSAQPGRPCRLPAGLSHDEPDGVRSLLCAQGMLVVLDGYNVTKDPRGVGAASLTEQRRWLLQLAAGVAARYRVRAIVVFDSAEILETAVQGLRGVVVDFATGEQTADDRIVELVRDLPADRPVVVVTSDRELRQRCAALGADVVPSSTFLSVAA